MVPQDDVYRRLQRHLDRMPIPFPATDSGAEIRLLEQLFTPEEAAIALALSAVAEPVEKIHRRLRNTGIAREQLEEKLAAMARNGCIMAGRASHRGKACTGYHKAPLVVGMYEFQVDRLTKPFVEAFRSYGDAGFQNPIVTKKTSQMRTVPINVEVGQPGAIARYDDILGYVRGAHGPFGVMNCVCRQEQALYGHTCETTDVLDTCLTMGASAVYMQRIGRARLVRREEFLEVLSKAEEKGLVLQPQNAQEPQFICCCCRDCCGVLQSARKMPRPAELFKTNFLALVDAASCQGCGTCVKRCPMDAVTLDEKRAVVDRDRCIGCGLCSSRCARHAIRLHPKDTRWTPPHDSDRMYQKIMIERYGPVRTLAMAVRVKLGMKI
jgi:Na+-translocating ferredoxin:NAD+ oxidoreductase subunit B